MTNILPIVVRVQLTLDTPLDPALRRAGPAAADRALDELHGLLAIEVDGVDLTGGRAEGPALPALEALLAAVARLEAGEAAAAAALRGEDLLLLLRRRGFAVGLTLVDLGPPARLPVRDLEVDLAALAAAALAAAAALCRALAGAPSAGALAARRLKGAARRPAPSPGLAAAPTRAGPPAPAGSGPTVRCEVTIDEAHLEEARPDAAGPAGLAGLLVPGVTRLAFGPAAVEVAGLPFLTLRDLVGGLAEVARAEHRGDGEATVRLGRHGRAPDLALRFDLGRGLVSWGAGQPLPARPLEVAEAALAAAAGLGASLGLAPPGEPAPAPLVELLAAASAAVGHLAERGLGDLGGQPAAALLLPARTPGPSQAPLGPGVLRRVALRPAWQAHVGPPVGSGLWREGAAFLAAGEEAVVGRRGARGWQAEGAAWAAAVAGLLLVRRGDRLSALEPGSGRVRWTRALPEAHPTAAAGRPGGALFLAEAGALTALDPGTGAPRWRLGLPGGHGLALAAFGPLLAAGTGSGLLYGVDLDGRLAWRVRAPGPALAPPVLAGTALASLHAAGPGAALLLVDPGSGRRLGEVALDVLPAGGPLRFAGGLAVAGRSGGAVVVTLVRPSAGRVWTVEAPLAGTPRLSVAGRALLAGDAGGALACLDPAGRVAWALPAAGERGAAGGAAPVAARGVVAAAREGLALLDLRSGRRLGGVAGLHPARLEVASSGAVAALEADGTVTGLSPAGHLSVLGPPPGTAR